MPTTLEQVINDARALLPDDQARLRQWLEEQSTRAARELQRQDNLKEDELRHQLILQWLKENRAKYVGQWVALDGDRLIAHGDGGTEFIAEVRASGVKAPFIERIVVDELPFGGW